MSSRSGQVCVDQNCLSRHRWHRVKGDEQSIQRPKRIVCVGRKHCLADQCKGLVVREPHQTLQVRASTVSPSELGARSSISSPVLSLLTPSTSTAPGAMFKALAKAVHTLFLMSTLQCWSPTCQYIHNLSTLSYSTEDTALKIRGLVMTPFSFKGHQTRWLYKKRNFRFFTRYSSQHNFPPKQLLLYVECFDQALHCASQLVV